MGMPTRSTGPTLTRGPVLTQRGLDLSGQGPQLPRGVSKLTVRVHTLSLGEHGAHVRLTNGELIWSVGKGAAFSKRAPDKKTIKTGNLK